MLNRNNDSRTTKMLWLQFIIGAVIVVISGSFLARQADILAEKTGLGHIWVGMLFLATITSLPELVVGVGASALENAPDLAVGDILGSNAFNLSFILFTLLLFCINIFCLI